MILSLNIVGGRHGGREHDHVKVTIIDTHYIQTDSKSFKSVVQSLTGKNLSSTLSVESESHSKMLIDSRDKDTNNRRHISVRSVEAAVTVNDNKVQFEEFEKLFMEFPPSDECNDIIYTYIYI
ncbi:hypothetical protein Scep_015066 [Stephania cephalantha]|uniref:VQ domain-containing protein n=1 Tax=Stephania cephalantha TaxID=152367 RepID=A0AAP0P2G2_9MAGN